VGLAEFTAPASPQQQAVIGMHERRHERKVHEQDLHGTGVPRKKVT